jgi:hypothetical protein
MQIPHTDQNLKSKRGENDAEPTRLRPRAKALAFKPHASDSLVGFIDVRMPSGLEIYGATVHVQGSRRWVNPPGKPQLDERGTALREDNGKIKYAAVLGFVSHGCRSNWSRQILRALDELDPQAAPAAVEEAAL